MDHGVLLIVCGPSGVGKTSLCRGLLEARTRLKLSVSYTTRAPREGEVDGVAYHFVDVPTFLEMREQGRFAEWAEVHGNFYGTSVDVIRSCWRDGQDVLFDIDYQGARQLTERFPHATTVLITPPDMHTLESRLRHRGTDDEATIARRLGAARHELNQYALFDYLVENGSFDEALEGLTMIYDASRYRRIHHEARLAAILSEQP
jgi:guanylate kinase